MRELQLTDNPSMNPKLIEGPTAGDGYIDILVSFSNKAWRGGVGAKRHFNILVNKTQNKSIMAALLCWVSQLSPFWWLSLRWASWRRGEVFYENKALFFSCLAMLHLPGLLRHCIIKKNGQARAIWRSVIKHNEIVKNFVSVNDTQRLVSSSRVSCFHCNAECRGTKASTSILKSFSSNRRGARAFYTSDLSLEVF